MIATTLALLPLLACGGKGEDSAAGPSEEEVQAVIAGYSGWSQGATWTGVQPGTGPHGDWVQIWWNDTAYAAYSAGEPTLPAGAALVKASYADEGGAEGTGLTVMWKEEADAWTWARLEADESLIEAGDIAMCADCHASGQDGVLSESW